MPRRSKASASTVLGPLEHRVMRALWDHESATVGEALETVNGTDGDLAYTTVMTVLTRLLDKKIVQREREGRGYRYTPAQSEAELVESSARREVDRLVDRFGEVALARFATTLEGVDPNTLERLRILAEADQ